MTSPSIGHAVADLPGWVDDDHAAAFTTFHRSASVLAKAPPPRGPYSPVRPADWVAVARAALALPEVIDRAAAQHFFEQHFRAVPVAASAFLTGYYEPELAGSRTATLRYRVPLHARPADLIDVTAANRPAGWPEDRPFGRASDSGLTPYHSRAAIEDGALDGRGLELVYLADPVDAFFVHVQGSCRIRLAEGPAAGTVLRFGYAARNGLPYTSIGRRLAERGVMPLADVTGATLTAWLQTHPAEGRALMRENASYVFFREQTDLAPDRGPLGAAGVQLTTGRSLAVDHRHHGYGASIWLDATLPLGTDGAVRPFRRLMVAQDTGSAIVGPARGDIFLGSGRVAAEQAGQLRHQADRFVVLCPMRNPAGGP